MAEDSYKVWETKALVRRRNVKEAEAILERVAKQVQPLMKRRRWKVRLVREVSATQLLLSSSASECDCVHAEGIKLTTEFLSFTRKAIPF